MSAITSDSRFVTNTPASSRATYTVPAGITSVVVVSSSAPPFSTPSSTYISTAIPVPSSVTIDDWVTGYNGTIAGSYRRTGMLSSSASVSSSTSSLSSFPSSSLAINVSQSSNSDDKPRGAPITIIVGVVVASVLLVVAGIVGRMWVRHRRAKGARQDARVMREIGRDNGADWSFEVQPPTLPPRTLVTRQALASRAGPSEANRESSAWSDDSEMDMMATDGSTLARTLSSRSTSSDATIRTLAINTRDALDHPGYTYQSTASRSTPTTALLGHSNTSTLRSPFTDSAESSSASPLSPFADQSPISSVPSSQLRPESRLSTTSSENPFRDPLPAYTLQEAGRAPPEVLSGIPMLGGNGGLERALQRPPPAYAERDRAAR